GALLSTMQFLFFSKMATLDVPLVFFLCAALLCFLKGKKGSKNWLFGVGIFFALAALTKGLSALIIPVVIFLSAVLSGEFKALLKPALFVGLAAGIVIILPWHIFEYCKYKELFLDGYLFKHLIRRTTMVLDGHTGNSFYYLNVIMNKGRPWGILGIVSLVYMLYPAFKKSTSRPANRQAAIFVLSWALAVLGIFTLTKTKLPWYAIPIYPALSIATATVLEKFLKQRWVLFFILVIIIIASYSTKYHIFNLDFNKEAKSLASIAQSHSSEEKGVYLYRVSDPGIIFYFGDVFKKLDDEASLMKLVTPQTQALFLMNKQDYDKLLLKLPAIKILATSNYHILFSR
ncbi:MAG: glycosyltransferase family 39 protein, partial [Candidatus Omnitrophota bacterium]